MAELAQPDVIIIGAGLAGLTAALHLAERGLRVHLLEADPQYAGGRLKGGAPAEFTHAGRTWRFAGEHGMHAIWSPYRNLQALLARHQIRPVLVPAQEEAWIHGQGAWVRGAATGSVLRGSWIPAPFHYLGLFAKPAFLAMLSLRDYAAMPRVLVGLLAALSIDPLGEDRSLPGFTLAQFCHWWSPKLIALFVGLARNFVSGRLEEIPAAGFMAFLRFYTLRRRDAWAFSYLPEDSPRSLIAPLFNKIQSYGGLASLGARVTCLEQVEGGWQASWEQDGNPRTLTAPHLILAVDAPAAAALLQASPALAPVANALRLPIGTPTAIFRFWFNCSPRLTGAGQQAEAGIFSGDFILDNFFWLHCIYNEYIEWARATGGSVLESHIYGPPELLARPDAALLSMAQVDVGRVWPELRDHLIHITLERNPATHTLPDVGRPAEHLAIATPWPHLLCCGDWVRDPNPALFMERACVTGIKAANLILAERGRPTWPLVEYCPAEPFAAWLEHGMRRVRAALRRQVQRDR